MRATLFISLSRETPNYRLSLPPILIAISSPQNPEKLTPTLAVGRAVQIAETLLSSFSFCFSLGFIDLIGSEIELIERHRDETTKLIPPLKLYPLLQELVKERAARCTLAHLLKALQI